MKKEDLKEFSKYFLLFIIAVFIFLSFKIVQPYLISIVSAFILAFFSRPLYEKLNKKMRSSYAALVCILLVILIMVLPLAGLMGGVSSQALEVANKLEDVPSFIERFDSWSVAESLNIKFDEVFKSSTLFLGSLFGSAISYLPKLLLAFVILVFGMYYFLVGWKDLTKRLRSYIPLKNKGKISTEISNITKEIVHGFFFVALIEFAVAALGFYIVGVGPYLLFAVLIFFFGFIPGLGAALIWIPLAVYYILSGNIAGFAGVLMVGVVLTFLIELVLRSKVIGVKTKINPFVMIIGILGGISMFGIFGFIIGPLILTYSLRMINVLAKDMSRYH